MGAVLDDLKNFARYCRGLDPYLSAPPTVETARRQLAVQLGDRSAIWLRMLQRGVYSRERSPYRALLQHAGVSLGDIRTMVERDGVEGALGRLYEVGVYVTLEEFKGRRPIERPGLSIPVRAHDFDNPLLVRHYAARTGGSRGVGRRVLIDLELLEHEAAYLAALPADAAAPARPIGIWYSVPPGVGGIKLLLWHARLGRRIERWFTQTVSSVAVCGPKQYILLRATLSACRRHGLSPPAPIHAPLGAADRVARWLAQCASAGRPAELHTNPSSAMRICAAVEASGIDIAGSVFHLYSEPLTASRVAMLAAIGCTARGHYNMAEVGRIALACSAPAEADEAHVLSDKVAIIQPESTTAAGEFVMTTLLASCPKLMLNVRTGDRGVLTRRDCGCPVQDLGFHAHAHTIRCHEKFTSEGMHVIADDLLELTDATLPARFGGYPTDYQFVEDQAGALPRVSLVINPRVGEIDTDEVLALTLKHLRSGGGPLKMMADRWCEGGTLRVERRDAHVTPSSKILPIHTDSRKE